MTQEVAIVALQALDATHACGLLNGDVEVLKRVILLLCQENSFLFAF
jgi:hypothetical protein